MPESPVHPTHELTERQLADLCVDGQIPSGIELCNRLRDRGLTPTIDRLVEIAVPSGEPTFAAFDHLTDALHYWGGPCR